MTAMTSLTGHTLKLYKCSFRTNIGKYSFSNIIIDDWNNLPQHVVSSNTVNTFKYCISSYYRSSILTVAQGQLSLACLFVCLFVA